MRPYLYKYCRHRAHRTHLPCRAQSQKVCLQGIYYGPWTKGGDPFLEILFTPDSRIAMSFLTLILLHSARKHQTRSYTSKSLERMDSLETGPGILIFPAVTNFGDSPHVRTVKYLHGVNEKSRMRLSSSMTRITMPKD